MKLNRFIKSFIVTLGFLSILSGYTYYRVIRPYLNLGVIVKPDPTTPYFKQVVQIDGETYSYWTNGNKNTKKILVLLPPSSSMGNYFAKYAEQIPNVLIISPDYPGRGETSRIKEFDTSERLARRVSILLKYLIGNKEFTVVGPSFGGMIATKLAEDNSLKINNLFLVATGEFFAPDQQSIFHLIFYPAVVSEKIRLKYLSFLQNVNVFSNLDPINNEDLMEQWLTVLDYKVNTSFKSQIPTKFIIFLKDNVIQSTSYPKLMFMFPNNKTYILDVEHKSTGFFNQELIEIIKNNI